MLISSILKSTRRPAAVLLPEASVADAAELLGRDDVQIVVVCNNKGEAQGIVADSDIMRDLANCRGKAAVCASNIGALMTRDVVSCRERDSAEEVLSVMKARGLRRIPVVDDQGRLVGLVTMRDVLLYLYEQAKFDEVALKDYFLGVGYH